MAVTFSRVAPVLPVRDVTRALEHYRKLGFEADAYTGESPDDPIYGFVKRGSIELHLTRFAEMDPKANTSACYLYVDDADALYAAWRAAGVPGRLDEPRDTPYRLREILHLDPDGNLLRVGSPLA